MSADQGTLFDLPPPEVEAVEHAPLDVAVPRAIRFGGMSWNYPGWRGLVYAPRTSEDAITRHGLTAYAKHPLLRAAEIDRTYYEPLSADAFAELARQVPDDFRFVVKAHEETTVARFPNHARYGKVRGAVNPRFLDVAYAVERVIEPAARGLGDKLGAILFQFPPHPNEPSRFADDLHAFLRRLPTTVRYVVELRNAELLTRAYVAALADASAVHCHNAWTGMPDVITQAKAVPPRARHPLVVRWLASHGDSFEDAAKRFAPYDRLVTTDDATCAAIARLASKAAQHAVPSFVFVSNHAEGCAPRSIARLATAISALE